MTRTFDIKATVAALAPASCRARMLMISNTSASGGRLLVKMGLAWAGKRQPR
jgi:hypothetical protein